MGLSSSQARMLLLTARKSDLEYRAQMISQRKINLAMQTEQLANQYSQSMSNRMMKLNYATVDGTPQYEKLSYAGITATNSNYVGDYIVKTASNKYAVTDTVDALKIAAKLENASGGTRTVSKVMTYQYKDADGKTKSTNLSYSAITAMNNVNSEDAGDYVVKTKDGKYAVADETDALRIAAKLGSVDGKTVDTTKMTDAEKKKLLDTYKDQITYNSKLTDNNYFQTALKSGDLVLAAAKMEKTTDAANAAAVVKKGYENTTLDKVTGITEQEAVTYNPIDLSKMTAEEKTALLAKYKDKFSVVPEMSNPDYFQDALRNGGLYLFKAEMASGKDTDGNNVTYKTGYTSISWNSCGVIADVLNTGDDAQAESEYESKTVVLSNQDKMLDLELNQIETQHKAIETEYDSVKKVIEKNIDVSYKIFA